MDSQTEITVLLGGGVESTALVDDFLIAGEIVTPIHISCGLRWDEAESNAVRRFLDERKCVSLRLLIEIQISIAGFISDHWAIGNSEFPNRETPNLSLEIPHRNLLLLAMAIHRVKASSFYRIAIGTTAENNYSDGSRKYFDKCEEVLSMEMECPVTIITPFIGLTKVDVIKRSRPETLGLSFSCVAPIGNDHCGMCIKCQKKRLAFREAGLPDPTRYFS